MSRNEIVSIQAINAALSLTIRDFSSVLFVVKGKAINENNLPKAITSVAEFKELGYDDDAKETALVKDYFGANPKPDYIWVYGENTSEVTYTKILEGLDVRFRGKWFYTLAAVSEEGEVKEIIDFLKGTSVNYVALLQGAQNFTTEVNLKIAKENPTNLVFYVATDKKEGQVSNLVATVKDFFPGSVPFAAIKLNGLTGSTFSESEKLKLVGIQRTSDTGVNLVTEEDQMVIPYYGKAMDGTTWFDYSVATIAIDEYMRVYMTKYIVEKNTLGEKIPANGFGKSLLVSKGIEILKEFADRGIIYNKEDLLMSGEKAFEVKIVSLNNREAEIEYKCWFQGAIIKSKVAVKLNSEKGN